MAPKADPPVSGKGEALARIPDRCVGFGDSNIIPATLIAVETTSDTTGSTNPIAHHACHSAGRATPAAEAGALDRARPDIGCRTRPPHPHLAASASPLQVDLHPQLRHVSNVPYSDLTCARPPTFTVRNGDAACA